MALAWLWLQKPSSWLQTGPLIRGMPQLNSQSCPLSLLTPDPMIAWAGSCQSLGVELSVNKQTLPLPKLIKAYVLHSATWMTDLRCLISCIPFILATRWKQCNILANVNNISKSSGSSTIQNPKTLYIKFNTVRSLTRCNELSCFLSLFHHI